MNGTIRALAILLALSASGGMARPPGPPPGVEVRNCPRELMAVFDPGPISAGPLRLVSILCLSDPMLSPDGSAGASWREEPPASIAIAGADGTGRVEIPNRVLFRSFAYLSGVPGSSPDALAWSADSRSLWAVRQALALPRGFALGGLEPIAIGRDGTVRALPPLSHPAGSLDGLMWVGGEGLALALFGGRGDFYRPEHGDPEPTLAMVDAARGRCSTRCRRGAFPSWPGASTPTA